MTFINSICEYEQKSVAIYNWSAVYNNLQRITNLGSYKSKTCTKKNRHKKLKENPHKTNKQADKQKQEEQNTY